MKFPNLSSQFIYMDDVQQSMQLALASQLNVIYHGPGGHGKSDAARFFLQNFCQMNGIDPKEVFMQSLHGDTDEASLYGGLNMKALHDSKDPRIEYNLQRSFMNFRYVIFEELLDAPARVLLSLKDTLVAKEFNGAGGQHMALRTEVIVGLTNKPPQVVAEMGQQYEALIGRFPISYLVEWPRYEATDFLSMIQLRKATNTFSQNIAMLAAEGRKEGILIDPRTVMYANRAVATTNNLMNLKFLKGFDRMSDTITEKINYYQSEVTFDREVARLWKLYNAMPQNTTAEALMKSSAAANFLKEMVNLKWNDSFKAKRDENINRMTSETDIMLNLAKKLASGGN